MDATEGDEARDDAPPATQPDQGPSTLRRVRRDVPQLNHRDRALLRDARQARGRRARGVTSATRGQESSLHVGLLLS
jgi:hypothetical protein